MAYAAIERLVRYGLDKGLIQPADAVYSRNRLLEILNLPGNGAAAAETGAIPPFAELLRTLVANAIGRGLIADTQGGRDLFDTKLMGALTPPPSIVVERFSAGLCRIPRRRQPTRSTHSAGT